METTEVRRTSWIIDPFLSSLIDSQIANLISATLFYQNYFTNISFFYLFHILFNSTYCSILFCYLLFSILLNLTILTTQVVSICFLLHSFCASVCEDLDSIGPVKNDEGSVTKSGVHSSLSHPSHSDWKRVSVLHCKINTKTSSQGRQNIGEFFSFFPSENIQGNENSFIDCTCFHWFWPQVESIKILPRILTVFTNSSVECEDSSMHNINV